MDDATTTPARQGSEDDGLLTEFGYRQELPRVLRFWTNWALGFAFISPIVGLYTVVALGAQTAGPAWVWVLPIVWSASCSSRWSTPTSRVAGRSPVASTSGPVG